MKMPTRVCLENRPCRHLEPRPKEGQVSMKDNTSIPSAEGVKPRSPAFDIIFDMEDDVCTAVELSNGLVLMLSGVGRSALEKKMEENAMLRVAYILRDHVASIQGDWKKAFVAMGGRT